MEGEPQQLEPVIRSSLGFREEGIKDTVLIRKKQLNSWVGWKRYISKMTHSLEQMENGFRTSPLGSLSKCIDESTEVCGSRISRM